jgi:glycogen operon protein
VNFSVFSHNALSVTLEIYAEEKDDLPASRYTLDSAVNRTGDLWHIFLPGLQAGVLYLYRVDGPFDPGGGMRFNKNAPLLDPYARALTGASVCREMDLRALHPASRAEIDCGQPLPAGNFPKCVVVDGAFDWQGDKPLNYPLQNSLIYEAHVRGLTMGPGAGTAYPGTYRGIIEKIPYLKDLGVTTLELLPVHEFDQFEMKRVNPRTGKPLTNYWGYSTVAFFAPKAAYAISTEPGGALREFKEMVRELHKNNIEVILDVVFNHTAEGNENGPTISFRGLDNAVYYMLEAQKNHYRNYSGCGNTFNCGHPVVRRLILDCLRYWMLEMHVDGFRFDLAAVLNRDAAGNIMGSSSLSEIIAEEPVLAATKLIAEPWDAGGGYQVGAFPGRWAEWNDRYRDDMRRFWHGEAEMATAAATRFAGSADLYKAGGRRPFHSVNYVACHDGFTLNDLVSYNNKHNEVNGEDNRDGSGHNCSFNYGFEGPTENPAIEALRVRQIKNLFLTLMLSQGTPLILSGDEVRHTQQGNNNTYCQDNELSWFDWRLVEKNAEMFRFCRAAIAFRKAHAAFRRPDFFDGSDHSGNFLPDIRWCGYNGKPMDWRRAGKFLAFRIDGSRSEILSDQDDNGFYILCNADTRDVSATMPPPASGKAWYRVVDTSIPGHEDFMEPGSEENLHGQKVYVLPARSMAVLMER